MPATDGAVIRSHQAYFEALYSYRAAASRHKPFILRGTLFRLAQTLQPYSLRRRLQLFWEEEATKQGLDISVLKTWA